MSVCFPVGTHGVYQEHLRSPAEWKSLPGISRAAGLEGGWVAAAWQGTWHEGQGTLGKALEAQLGACCHEWFSHPGGLVPVCVCV